MNQTTAPDARALLPALLKGLAQRCPSCGAGRLFARYLKTVTHCQACGEEMHHHRADDAPPYFSVLIIGHIVIPGLLLVEQLWSPPTWVQLSIWLPLSCLLIWQVLPRVKGALVGLQWANRMHGFGD